MTARSEGRRRTQLSRPSLVLAAASTTAVAAAAVTGHDFSGPEVVGAFAVAGTIAALNARSRPLARPHVLSSIPEDPGTVVIGAERARSMAAHPAAGHGHSDAA